MNRWDNVSHLRFLGRKFFHSLNEFMFVWNKFSEGKYLTCAANRERGLYSWEWDLCCGGKFRFRIVLHIKEHDTMKKERTQRSLWTGIRWWNHIKRFVSRLCWWGQIVGKWKSGCRCILTEKTKYYWKIIKLIAILLVK